VFLSKNKGNWGSFEVVFFADYFFDKSFVRVGNKVGEIAKEYKNRRFCLCLSNVVDS